MNREQAVEIIERHIDNNIASGSLVEQALSMAIDALKAQLSKEDTTKDTTSYTINRQQALEKLRTMQTYKLFEGDDMLLVDKAEVQTELMMLPPAQSEPKEGHWILHETSDGGEQYECSECGVLWEFNDGTPEDNEAFYCPKCGVKMKGEQDGH